MLESDKLSFEVIRINIHFTAACHLYIQLNRLKETFPVMHIKFRVIVIYIITKSMCAL